MAIDNVDRVTVKSDEDWIKGFIPWLENHEKNHIGLEDGVFVATVDPTLRTLQPQDEENFLESCIQTQLSTVSRQTLKKFTGDGLYHLGGHSALQEDTNKFKEEASRLHSYKDDTCWYVILLALNLVLPVAEMHHILQEHIICHGDKWSGEINCYLLMCTRILNKENCSEKLFNHIYSDVICENVIQVPSSHQSHKSRVLLEEAALKLRKEHEKYSENTKEFNFECQKKVPPKQCPDLECTQITDSEESDFEDETGGIPEGENMEKSQRSEEEDVGNSSDIFYGHGLESCSKDIQITSKLNFSKIYNILWLLPYFYPGFHSSYLYFGTKHSMFPVHIEDGLCWGLNFLFMGLPKIWVIIPPWGTDLLEYHLQRGGLYLLHSKCQNLLGHKVFFPTVSWLKERRIPFKIVVQCPGDLVVLYPNAAHFGFNLGPNIAQAVNIATKSWIPWGINAKKCTCLQKQIHLNILPIVAAFREDLLPCLLTGGVVVTPQSVRGIQLLYDELTRIETLQPVTESQSALKKKELDGEEEVTTFKCPAKKCKMAFPVTLEDTKMRMVKHAKAAHKPILAKSQLLQKIDMLFVAIN